MIKTVDPNYECTILRAGGFNINLSSKVLCAMREVGLRADSSVFPGGYSETKYEDYDYRVIPQTLPYWKTCRNDILSTQRNYDDSNENIYELPIFALSMTRFRKYDLTRLKSKLRDRSSIKTTFTQAETRMKKRNKLKYFFETESVTWDYCLFSYSKMKYFFSKAMEIIKKSSFDYHPFILIGHSKDFVNSSPFEDFLAYIRKRKLKDIQYCTLTDVLRKIGTQKFNGFS